MTQRGRLRLGLGIAAAVLAADQMAKQFVLHDADLAQRFGGPLLPGLLDLTLVRNHGVTFGLLQAGSFWGEMLLSAIAIAVVAALLLWLRRAEHALVAAAIGGIAGGALGNVADRFRFGQVTDFLHLHWGGWDPFPYVFNLGDSAIVLGVAALLLEGTISPRPSAAQPPAPAADDR